MVRIRNLFRNAVRVLAVAVRAAAGFVEAPYRRRLYKRTDKRTILFNITMNNHFELFKRVYNRLNQDERLRICFTDSLSGGRKWLSFLLEQGVEAGQILGWEAVILRRWDVCIDPDYYSPVVLRPAKWVQTSHGVAGRRRPDTGVDYTVSKRLRRYDKFFCYSKDQQELMRASGWLKSDGAAVLTGYPKLDGLVDGSFSRDEVLRSYGADPAKLSVLYAPSWCSEFSLEQIGDELIDLLSDGPWTLLVKLHPISYQPKTRSLGEDRGHKHNWRGFLDDRAKQGSLIHVLDQGTCRYMTAADILITDQGSTLFEYMVLGRPILYYDTDEGNKFIYIRGRLEKIRRAAHSFQTPQEALELLKSFSGGQLLDGLDKMQAKKECVQEVFYDVGRATDRAVAAIYELLQLEPL
jgi:hypothetical protein